MYTVCYCVMYAHLFVLMEIESDSQVVSQLLFFTLLLEQLLDTLSSVIMSFNISHVPLDEVVSVYIHVRGTGHVYLLHGIVYQFQMCMWQVLGVVLLLMIM